MQRSRRRSPDVDEGVGSTNRSLCMQAHIHAGSTRALSTPPKRSSDLTCVGREKFVYAYLLNQNCARSLMARGPIQRDDPRIFESRTPLDIALYLRPEPVYCCLHDYLARQHRCAIPDPGPGVLPPVRVYARRVRPHMQKLKYFVFVIGRRNCFK